MIEKVFQRSAPKSKSPPFCSPLKPTVPQDFTSSCLSAMTMTTL